MDKHFTLEIVTPVKTVNFEEVEYLRAPSLEGLFGVMPGHVSSIINLDILVSFTLHHLDQELADHLMGHHLILVVQAYFQLLS